MNILFLTLADIRSIDNRGIYADLMRQFAHAGHHVYIVSPVERRCGMNSCFLESSEDALHSHVHILKVRTGNVQKTNIIEKGISTILLEYQLLHGIRKFFRNIRFDLVLYSTPPITLVAPIRYIKKRDGAKTYLMLKDIFPQNAVDIGMMTTGGIKGILYRSFRAKESKLYALSDKIGCMSPANCDYVLRHNPEIAPERVELFPNCVEICDMSVSAEERTALRSKYGIPLDKKVFVYGGNLGKPQGIPFLIECLKAQQTNPDAFFLVVGSGTEYAKIDAYMQQCGASNMKLMQHLPKEDYDRMVAACDIGMIFLDHRFTIPNFPSRLLAYMQAGIPVLAATDPNTDIGKVIVEGGFGWWCESNDVQAFSALVESICASDNAGERAVIKDYLYEHYDATKLWKKIID